MKVCGSAKIVGSRGTQIVDGFGRCQGIDCGRDRGWNHGGCLWKESEIRSGVGPPHLVGRRGVPVKESVSRDGSCRACHGRSDGPPDSATPRVEESVGSPRVAEIGGGCPCWGSGVD